MEARRAGREATRITDQRTSLGIGATYSRSVPLQSIPRNDRRDVILDRIVESLNREGSQDADWTLSHLARAGNTSRVTLYEYFGNLEGLRSAIRMKTIGDVEPIVSKLKHFPKEERHRIAVSQWMSWVDENRPLAIRAMWIDGTNPVFEGFVAGNRHQLVQQICDVYIGVSDPSPGLRRQVEVYLSAAEYCLRMWLLEGRLQRREAEETFNRLVMDAVRMAEGRDDVPKPLPGRDGSAT